MTAYLDKTALRLEWTVAPEHDGLRADQYLCARIGRLSRNKAQRIVLSGDFRRADAALKPSGKLRVGERVDLWRLPPKEDELDRSSVTIIHEDENWLVVDKPPHLAVHPSARYLYNTLTAWLKQYAPNVPIHPCHRLDRETSGVLVCAKNRGAEAGLKVAFQDGRVRKSYIAVVRGKFETQHDVNVPLGLQGDKGLVRIRMVVGGVDSVPARTLVAPLGFDPQTNRSIVKCEPQTGRQHQIRAHLAHIGYPIVGDKLYAMGDAFFDAFTKREVEDELLSLEHPRHALHALDIEFEFAGENLKFCAAVPEDFRVLMSRGVLSAISE